MSSRVILYRFEQADSPTQNCPNRSGRGTVVSASPMRHQRHSREQAGRGKWANLRSGVDWFRISQGL
jgi:hypothetical protein